MTQTQLSQAVGVVNEALSLVTRALTCAPKMEDSNAQDFLENSLIDIGVKLKSSQYDKAFEIFTVINKKLGMPFLKNELQIALDLRSLEDGFTLNAEFLRDEFIALCNERKAIFKGYLIPLSEKIMLLAMANQPEKA